MSEPTPPEPTHRFSADRPLQHLAEDRLERGGFAERLASDIFGWHGADSLIISLNGDWGTGKTSLKNFVKERLALKGNPIVVEFNPWEWSGQDKVFEAFFTSMRTAFRETDAHAETEKMVERWEAFEAWTKLGAEISGKIEKAIAPLLGTSITAALLANTASTSWVRIVGIALGLLGGVVASFLATFPDIAARVLAVAKARAGHAPKKLAELRKEIAHELEKLRQKKRPVLVIVDDIDRLTQNEIRFLFQLIKVNADFPNVVFLLLFPKGIVVDALSGVVPGRGDEYLQKIVQVEFDVPHAPRPRMLKIFQDDLNRVFARKSPQMQWDKERINDLFEDYLWPYFATLRDVKRFIGTFDFYFHGHVNEAENVLEVNPIDLLAIEVLRTFDHEAYLTVRDSLGFSSRSAVARLLIGDAERKEQIKIELEAITARPGLSREEKERLRGLLQRLFPEGKLGDARFMSEAERTLRICHPDHFTKYFEHALDETPTSAANMHALLRLSARREEFAARLRARCQDGTLEDVFEKIGLYFDDIPVESAAGFIGAMCDVGDELPPERVDMFNRDPIFNAVRLSYLLLKKLPDDATRSRVLEETIKSSTGTVFPVVMVWHLEPGEEKKQDREPQVVSDAQLAGLRELALTRIAGFAKSEKIWASRHFAKLLYRWRAWGNPAVVNEWLASQFTTPQRRLDFLVKMLQRSIINGSRVEYYLDGQVLEEFVDLESLYEAVRALPVSADDERTSTAPKLLRRALAFKKAGRPYSHVELKGDFDPET